MYKEITPYSISKLTNEINSKLSELISGDTLSVKSIPMHTAEEIITDLSGEEILIEDTNGHDLDWSIINDVDIQGSMYHIYGSGSRGTLIFNKK